MTKEIAIKQSYEIDFNSKDMIETLKATVAVGATDAEFKMFAEFCKSTGLNPFKKEIWFIVVPEKKWTDWKTKEEKKRERKIQMMTGINGYLAIANRHPQFDGMEIEPHFGNNNELLSVKCLVYRKDRSRPHVGIALYEEYKQDTAIWKEKKFVMLSKVAKSIALREAFPQELNGLYTEEEMPKDYAMPKQENEENKTIALLPESMKSKVVVAETIKQEEVVLPFVYCFLGATEADKKLAKAEFKKMKHSIEENGVKILVKTEKKLSEKWDAYILDFPEITFKDDELPDSYHQAKINNETINLKTGEVVE